MWAISDSVKLGLFSADQVCRLAKISETQLRYWYQTNVFRPERLEKAYGPYHRVYSFRDVVGLRAIGILRNVYHVNLEDLRTVEARLKGTPDAGWSNVVFYVGEDRHVYFPDPKTGEMIAVTPTGQTSLFRMRAVITNVEKRLVRMNRRTKKQIGHIDHHRFIMRNASVIAGTRILTSSVFELYKAGFTPERIVAEYPRLTIRDVRAAIRFEKLKLAS